MANSSGRRSFLIKVNSNAAPREIGIPRELSQWEHGAFLTQHPRKTIKRDGHQTELRVEQREAPRDGDRLYIWINSQYGGRGLTATARASGDASPAGSGLSTVVRDVELTAGIDRIRAKRLARPGNVFDDVIQSTSGATLRWISDEDARDIDDAVRQDSTGTPPMSLPSMPADPGDLAERQRVMRLIEQRANQGPFRDAVMARDGKRCIVTGCRTPRCSKRPI
jgi:hypothetical protein